MHKKAAILFWNIARPVTVQVQTATLVLYIFQLLHVECTNNQCITFTISGSRGSLQLSDPHPGRFTNHPNFWPIMPSYASNFGIAVSSLLENYFFVVSETYHIPNQSQISG